jgi:predicted transcriptional regulator
MLLVPEVEQAEESPLTWSQIEKRAEDIALQYDFDRDAETIRHFAERLGGKVKVLPPKEVYLLESGSLVVRGQSDFDIFLSPSTSILRDNFTVAHELGHYFLHSGNPPGSRRIKATRYGTDRCEQQANRFAAALLMPAAEFREVAARISKDALAGWFRVSTQAVEARLSSLRIL